MLRVSTREAIDVLRYDELTWRLERLLLYSGDCELGCYYQRVATGHLRGLSESKHWHQIHLRDLLNPIIHHGDPVR